jgi:hypothetical protein
LQTLRAQSAGCHACHGYQPNKLQQPDSHELTETVVLHCKTAQTITPNGPFEYAKRAVRPTTWLSIRLSAGHHRMASSHNNTSSAAVPQSLFRHGPLGITIKQNQWLAGGQAP